MTSGFSNNFSNLPPGCTDADVERAFGGPDANQIAEAVEKEVAAAIRRTRKSPLFPIAEIDSAELDEQGNVRLKLTIHNIDPDMTRLLGHMLLNVGRELL